MKTCWWIVLLLGTFVIAAILPFCFSLTSEPEQQGLVGWSNYGQWFGFVAALFSSVAFMVAFRTLQLQQQQIREADKTATRTIQELTAQTSALKDTAEINGLAAIIHYCERYRHIDPSDDKKQLDDLATKAKDRLKQKLGLDDTVADEKQQHHV